MVVSAEEKKQIESAAGNLQAEIMGAIPRYQSIAPNHQVWKSLWKLHDEVETLYRCLWGDIDHQDRTPVETLTDQAGVLELSFQQCISDMRNTERMMYEVVHTARGSPHQLSSLRFILQVHFYAGSQVAREGRVLCKLLEEVLPRIASVSGFGARPSPASIGTE